MIGRIRRPHSNCTPVVRAIVTVQSDLGFVCSDPFNSVGMARALNEVEFHSKASGGAVVGLQSTGKGPAWTLAQRVYQLRAMASGAHDAIPRHRRAHFALRGAGRGRRASEAFVHDSGERGEFGANGEWAHSRSPGATSECKGTRHRSIQGQVHSGRPRPCGI